MDEGKNGRGMDRETGRQMDKYIEMNRQTDRGRRIDG
jgi:hypothetical protein